MPQIFKEYPSYLNILDLSKVFVEEPVHDRVGAGAGHRDQVDDGKQDQDTLLLSVLRPNLGTSVAVKYQINTVYLKSVSGLTIFGSIHVFAILPCIPIT